MFDKFKNNNSVTMRIVLIGFLILVLMVPTMFIRGLIFEREQRQREAMNEVSEKWGMSQTFQGPVVSVPYLKWPQADRNIPGNLGYVHLLPDVLNVEANLTPEVRSRGIFEVPLYTADLNVSGTFSKNASLIPIAANQLLWDGASLSVGVSDIRGLKEQIRVTFDGKEVALRAGVFPREVFQAGVGANVTGFETKETHDFSFNLVLNGSENLSFAPMGKETSVRLTSSWKSPSFNGNFLPTEREITDEGFKASWTVLDVNRNYPQVWIEPQYDTSTANFGVGLFTPVDHYQQTERSVKYAILFIILTFLTFFLVEVMMRFRVHPVQYLLVGSAIVLFYLLLLSLSEHVGFNWAYLIASLGIVGMVSLYSGSVLRVKKRGTMIGLLLALLYIFLYFLLQLEDFALILGSVGLFIILGVVMYLTRNIDWYALKSEE